MHRGLPTAREHRLDEQTDSVATFWLWLNLFHLSTSEKRGNLNSLWALDISICTVHLLQSSLNDCYCQPLQSMYSMMKMIRQL